MRVIAEAYLAVSVPKGIQKLAATSTADALTGAAGTAATGYAAQQAYQQAQPHLQNAWQGFQNNNFNNLNPQLPQNVSQAIDSPAAQQFRDQVPRPTYADSTAIGMQLSFPLIRARVPKTPVVQVPLAAVQYGAGLYSRSNGSGQSVATYGALGTPEGNHIVVGAVGGLPYEQMGGALSQYLADPTNTENYAALVSPDNLPQVRAVAKGVNNTHTNNQHHQFHPVVTEGAYATSLLGSAAMPAGATLSRLVPPLAIPAYTAMAVDGARTVNDAIQTGRFLNDPHQVSVERFQPHGGLLGFTSNYTAPIATSSAGEYVNDLTGQNYTSFQGDWEKHHGINYDTGRFLWQDPSPRLPHHINNRPSFGPGRNAPVNNSPMTKPYFPPKPASNLPRL